MPVWVLESRSQFQFNSSTWTVTVIGWSYGSLQLAGLLMAHVDFTGSSICSE